MATVEASGAECTIDGVAVHYVEHGSGPALLVLHGAGVDHREIEAAVEAFAPRGLRRIYPDLPGMGRTRGAGRLAGNDDVVGLLCDLIDELAAAPALVLGHSYGAYLARGIAARRPESVRGLALLCPIGDSTADVPKPSIVRSDPDAYDELEPELHKGFDDYFVIRTAETARRYREHTVPGTRLVDQDELGRIFGNWRIDLGSESFDKPTLIVAGRRDSTAGYRSAVELLERYPAATLAVLEDAGHALPHEQPEQLGALVDHWARTAGAVGRDRDERSGAGSRNFT